MNAPPRPLRFLFIGFAGLSLLSGIWIGIARLGVALPLPNPAMIALHGPLMAIGFLLTLIGLERAAAVDRWWVYGIPLLSVLSHCHVNPRFATKTVGFFRRHRGGIADAVFLSAFSPPARRTFHRHETERRIALVRQSSLVLGVGDLPSRALVGRFSRRHDRRRKTGDRPGAPSAPLGACCRCASRC